MRTLFRGSVKKGMLVMGSDWIDTLYALEGQDIDVTIEKHRSTRSGNQNRYYFGVIVKMLSEETGYSKGEMHEVLKGRFLGQETKIGNETVFYTKDTSSLKTTEFEEYLSDIREWASVELGCYLPTPNEVDI